jgi:hypothetical protein
LTNDGTIIGGASGGGASIAGDGVFLDGGTLVNAGLIEGGGRGTADAVALGLHTATLVIDPGARFIGDVAGNASADDSLRLAAGADGSIAGLGTAFTGFTTVAEEAGASWALGGVNSLGSQTTLGVGGTLAVRGSLDDAGSATVGLGALLSNVGTGVLQFGSLQLDGGTLRGSAASSIVIGAGASAEGAIVVQRGASLAGSGGISGAGIIDDGSLVARGGTLTVGASVSGGGLIRIDGGATLQALGSLGTNLVFGTGGAETLLVGHGARVTGTIAGFAAGDTIDLHVTATTLTLTGGTLTLLDHGRVVDTLNLSGRYAATGFTLSSDHHGGTDIGYDSASPALLPSAQAWR